MSDTLALLPGDPGARATWRTWLVWGWAEVGFASNQYDRNGWTTYRPNFLYPLAAKPLSVNRDLNLRSQLTLVSTFSSESGVSRAKAISITCDLEYDMGRKR